MNPFRRRRPDPRTVEAVRRSLHDHAHDAPSGEHFAERVFAALDRAGGDPYAAPVRTSARRRRFAVPLVSAVGVLAVIAAVVLGVTQLTGGGHDTTASHPTGSVTQNPTPSPSPSPHVSSTTAATDVPAGSTSQVIRYDTLSDVKLQDVTFTGADDGWALASANCIRSSGTCTALLRTTDGKVWKSHPNTPFNVRGVQDCAAPCVTGLRFATDQIGYAFGPSAFFMTVNGGATWQQLPGGALGVETADQNVVRITSSGSGCPGPCHVGVETAAIGSAHWTARSLGIANTATVSGVQLARNGADVYLLVLGNPAGGAQQATSVLFRSSDDGAHWTRSGEPCPQIGGENDSTTIAAGDGGQVAVLCQLRGTSQAFVAGSSDGGATFSSRGTAPQRAGLLAVGGTGIYLLALDGLSRTTDAGAHWSTVSGIDPGFTWVGFESDTVARVVGQNGSVIWTTRDGGKTWTSIRFD